jgi:hypothetical protein
VPDGRARRVRHERLLRVLIVLIHDSFQEKDLSIQRSLKAGLTLALTTGRCQCTFEGTRSSSRNGCCGSFLSLSFPATMRPSAFWRTAMRLRDAGIVVDTPKLSKHSLPFAWLRDACPCPRCVHPSTRQKLFATSDLPPDIAPLSATNAAAVRENALHVQWSDGHASAYPLPFLEWYATEESTQVFHHDVVPVPWDTAGVRASPTLFTDYAALATSEGRLAAYEQVVRYGLLFVRGVPTAETNDASCELRTLAGRFGEIRRTFYGETWDVQSVKESKNIAYTNLDLGLHMDLLCVLLLTCV